MMTAQKVQKGKKILTVEPLDTTFTTESDTGQGERVSTLVTKPGHFGPSGRRGGSRSPVLALPICGTPSAAPTVVPPGIAPGVHVRVQVGGNPAVSVTGGRAVAVSAVEHCTR